jgi:hypothetical protein
MGGSGDGGSSVNAHGSQAPTANSTDELDPGLKYDTSGKKPIVLIPQPSDDPNDPLVRELPACLQETGSCADGGAAGRGRTGR